MNRPLSAGLALLCVVAASACDSGPTVGDTSTTSAPAPRAEQPMEPPPAHTTRPNAPAATHAPARRSASPRVERRAATDGAPAANTPASADGGAPRWVPRDATLTIVSGGDLDRNLGLAAPAATSIEIDAGAVQIGVQIHPAP